MLREEQAGFRRGRSCTDEIHTLRQLIEKCDSNRSIMFLNFVDFENTFDSVHRPTLWKILEVYSEPTKFINIFKNIYDGVQCCVKTTNGVSDWFDIKTGVRQGCVLSTLLFLIVIDFVMRKATCKSKGIKVDASGRTLSDLDFADDVVLLGEDRENLQQTTPGVAETGKYVGLKVNKNKTNPLVLGDGGAADILGTVICRSSGINAEITNRLRKAATVFGSMYKI